MVYIWLAKISPCLLEPFLIMKNELHFVETTGTFLLIYYTRNALYAPYLWAKLLSISANPSCVSRLPARQAAVYDIRAQPCPTLAQRRPLYLTSPRVFVLAQPQPYWTCGGPTPTEISTAIIARLARCADGGEGPLPPCSTLQGRDGRLPAPGLALS